VAGDQGDTGQLEAISPDGASSAAGPELMGISPHYDLRAPSVSSNGQLVAIDTTSGLNIVDLTGRHRLYTFVPEELYRSIAWSPDSSMLAVAGAATWNGVDIIRMSDGSDTTLPIVGGTLPDIIGWADETHVIGYFFPAPPVNAPTPTPAHSDANPPEGAQTLTLATEDVTSGAVRKVASITTATMGQGFFTLSPDGKFALFYNRLFRDNPYIQDVRLINVATGAVTSLPTIARAMGPYSGFTSIAWRENSMTVAASSGLRANGDVKTWLLDLSHDSAQPLPYQAYVAGWVPAGGPLILTSDQTDQTEGGPYQISAAIPTNGSSSVAVLTTDAYTFPFVGFVRTA
jgi:WD40 repeat protein